MKYIFLVLMRLLYTLSWPLSSLVLHNSRRARLVYISGTKILLVKTSLGSQKWELPGGGVKHGESAVSALQREVREEIGITINAKKLTPLIRAHVCENRLGWPKKDTELFVYKTSNVAYKINRPLEIIGVGWFPLDDLPNNVLADVRLAVSHI